MPRIIAHVFARTVFDICRNGSVAQPVTLTNTGSSALAITSITISGANLHLFSQTNTCGTSVAVGSTCTISVVFKPMPQKAVNAFLDELQLFGIGPSWGGFESLAIPFDCAPVRTATQWAPGGPTVRFHIGLEAVDDLLADLERGFAAMAAAV